MAVYTDYIAQEIKQNLKECIEKPKIGSGYFQTPLVPIVNKVGKVNYGESNYAVGPMTKTIYVEDGFGTHYKVSVEDLKHVKGHGWITHTKANELGVHWDRDEEIYVVDTPQYKAWLAGEKAKNFRGLFEGGQLTFDF